MEVGEVDLRGVEGGVEEEGEVGEGSREAATSLDLSIRGSREGVWVGGRWRGGGASSLRLFVTDCALLHMQGVQVGN